MPAWPGGPCPKCGVDVPAMMVRCRDCRVMLNTDLEEDTVEVPTFEPLKELDEYADAPCRGLYIECGGCRKELRINRKYLGTSARCKLCNSSLDLTKDEPDGMIGGYLDCPLCDQELKVASKYFGRTVACRFCEGRIRPRKPERSA